jgi:hypothetical protein
VECAGYKPFETEVNTKVDVYLGNVVLAKPPRTKNTKTKNTKTVKTKTKGTKAKKR